MLFILFGKSGVGKSTVLKDLIKYKKYKVEPIITYTTRPRRKDEKNDVDYHFIDKDAFLDMSIHNKFLEATKYKVTDGDIWYYGSAKEDYLKAKREDKIVIVNPDGIEPILKFCKENKIIVRVFYLHCHESVAIKRLEKRGDEWKEIKRRLAADDKDFTKDIIKCAHHKINTSCLSPKQTAIKVGTVIEVMRKS